MHELPKLPYAFDALEPFIDAKTMEIHHSKHHKTYTDKFNGVLEKHPELFKKKAEELIAGLNGLPEEIRGGVRNFGGGYVNHNFFWEVIGPNGGECKGKILELIKRDFVGFDEFKKKFSESALALFGSGWTWLVMDKDKKLKIINLPNQDSPLTLGMHPLLTIDVWEHSYYVKYFWNRTEYIKNWWNVVNWEKVNELFIQSLNK